MKMKFLVSIILCALFLSSCITNKDVVYLQDKGTVVDTLAINAAAKPYRLNINDQLKVSFKTELGQDIQEVTKIFNVTEKEPGDTEQQLYFSGNTIDVHGNIEFPVLGKINVLGYTLEEVEDKIKELLYEYYFQDDVELYVTVKLPGLKYTTLGEIGSSGPKVLYKNRVNIIEAIANAGDISQTGDRKDVLIVRQYPQGQKIHHIDLTDIAAMQSEFYYIKPNDIIMVKPLKRKALGAGQTATQTFTTIASIFSVLVSTYFLARNL
ncbi:sugar transporter [Aurantibacter aestuarii]|uniref:Sugar transporter n=2 Tax=Aurantibacter aestuarii TaxID=1266046 RepID=A0A2T1N5F1_9FLAO|nr:sugar transporter [Aurantibacter aestuarii]